LAVKGFVKNTICVNANIDFRRVVQWTWSAMNNIIHFFHGGGVCIVCKTTKGALYFSKCARAKCYLQRDDSTECARCIQQTKPGSSANMAMYNEVTKRLSLLMPRGHLNQINIPIRRAHTEWERGHTGGGRLDPLPVNDFHTLAHSRHTTHARIRQRYLYLLASIWSLPAPDQFYYRAKISLWYKFSCKVWVYVNSIQFLLFFTLDRNIYTSPWKMSVFYFSLLL
jgi:hypothetical protein